MGDQQQQMDPRVTALTKQFLVEVQTMHMRLCAIRDQTRVMGRVDQGDRDPFNIAVASVELLVSQLRGVLGMAQAKVLRGAQGADGKLEIIQ